MRERLWAVRVGCHRSHVRLVSLRCDLLLGWRVVGRGVRLGAVCTCPSQEVTGLPWAAGVLQWRRVGLGRALPCYGLEPQGLCPCASSLVEEWGVLGELCILPGSQSDLGDVCFCHTHFCPASPQTWVHTPTLCSLLIIPTGFPQSPSQMLGHLFPLLDGA